MEHTFHSTAIFPRQMGARMCPKELKATEPIPRYLDVLQDAGRSDTLGDADHFPLHLPPKRAIRADEEENSDS